MTSFKRFVSITYTNIVIITMALIFIIISPTLLAASAIDKIELYKRANKLLAENKMQALLNYLSPHELQFAGDIQYDYLLGIALLDTKNASLAIQVLQRVIDVSPNYAGARMGLARSYFDVGDFERAKYHFEILKSLPPPQNIAEVINQYLISIDRYSKQYTPHLSAWLEGSLGYDTNANGSTEDDFFLGFKLNEKNVESNSPFTSVLIGAQYSHPINTNWNFSSAINLSHRVNSDAHFVDLSRYQINGQLDRKFSFGYIYGKMTATQISIENHLNQRIFQGNLGINIKLYDSYSLNMNTLYAKLRFEDSLNVRDVDSTIFSLAFIKDFKNFNQLGINFSYGEDDAIEVASPYSNSQSSIQLFSRFVLGKKSLLKFNILASDIEYEDDYQFFGLVRDDRKYVVSTSYTLLDFISKNWQLSASIDWVKHESNIELYQYDRVQTALSIRKTFD